MQKPERKPAEIDAPLIIFRVFFEDGEVLTVRATDPNHACGQAKARHAGIIDKVKRDKSGDHG